MPDFHQHGSTFANTSQPQTGYAQNNPYAAAPQRLSQPAPMPTSPLSQGPTTPTTAGPTTSVATMAPQAPVAEKKQEALRVARDLFRQSPDWVTFFREILGVEGVVRRLFNVPEQLTDFEKCEEYGEIQLMIAKLRERTSPQAESKEPTRVITVRLPKSLHESLRVEAHTRRTSMNKLCISKLLQVVDDSMIPND
ncbi:hypothetical protein LOC68_06355 [Blastopirellula sp. JC732]|uniref:Toxin-antitoxin system HicB family antitoxin n=1 Tax=Blastopirellula sediminis TaxID=2894196 RepID=A0A9X1MKN1_9BACT|nr:hypothetical protein [Blastopirellula sediminis]MCC9609213.1 hypothetical protein [Blastopirellula sediminis]MCC9628010.1 hypothetical protein [Blastopirellula sediminis]